LPFGLIVYTYNNNVHAYKSFLPSGAQREELTSNMLGGTQKCMDKILVLMVRKSLFYVSE
jgi:hypothetical protein